MCLYRTILELKRVQKIAHWRQSPVFIAPYWNWNLDKITAIEKRLDVFIAPYWNWNTQECGRFAGSQSSLSHHIGIETELNEVESTESLVFIAPYWNWNQKTAMTFFEKLLSLSHHIGIETFLTSGTYVLRGASLSHHIGIETPYSRNACSLIQVFIAPYWNWNC